MKKIISLLLVLIFSLSLFSCNNNSNNNVVPEEESSAYDSLNDLEKLVFDVLIKGANAFFNPSELRVLNVAHAFKMDDGRFFTRLQLQGTNKIGGTITKWYGVLEDSSKPGTYKWLETSSIDAVCDDVSVAKINKAITEYWEEQGL